MTEMMCGPLPRAAGAPERTRYPFLTADTIYSGVLGPLSSITIGAR